MTRAASDKRKNGAGAGAEHGSWRKAGPAYPGVYVSTVTIDEELTFAEREQAYSDFMEEYENLIRKRAQRR